MSSSVSSSVRGTSSAARNLQLVSQSPELTEEESALLCSAIGLLATAFLGAVSAHRSQFDLGEGKRTSNVCDDPVMNQEVFANRP